MLGRIFKSAEVVGAANNLRSLIRRVRRDDYDLKNADLSSIVAACVRYIGGFIIQATPEVVDLRTGDVIKNHPMERLFLSPDPSMAGRAYWLDAVRNYIVHGNDYSFIHFAPMDIEGIGGMPVMLEHLPPQKITPKDDYYQYAGKPNIPIGRMVHIRGQSKPSDMKVGESPILSLRSLIDTDLAADRWTSALLRNSALMSVIINAKDDATDTELDDLAREIGAGYRGDEIGSPLIIQNVESVEQPSPDIRMRGLRELRFTPEERGTGVLGLNAVALHLGAGNEMSTYNNMRAAIQGAFAEGVIPVMDFIEAAFNQRLTPYYGEDIEFRLSYSQIESLQETNEELAERADAGFAANTLTQNEAREIRGLPPVSGGDVFAYQIAPAAPALPMDTDM